MMEFALIQKFEELFDGTIFYEEPGNRVIYEKDGCCYVLPENHLEIIQRSITENKNYILEDGHKIEYDPEVIY